MYGLNAFALVLFGAINVLSVQLCKRPSPARKRVLNTLCFILFFGNILRYALSPLLGRGLKIPVEFSAVAYFVVPVILFSARKKSQSWAAYSGLMAGFFYYMTMILAGGPIYNEYPPYDVYISMFCHGTLYLCGMVVIGTEKCSPKDGYKLVLGVALVAARALVLRPFAEGSGRLFIYELLDAVYVKRLFPPESWCAAVPLYYIVMSALILLSVVVFFRINKMRCKKYSALPVQLLINK